MAWWENGLYGNRDPYVCNGPRVHEYLQEMNQKVLSKYDLVTVGETAGVTIEEAKKYANLDGRELNMVFQFEHMDIAAGEHGKWTTDRISMPKLRKVLNKWQTELEGVAWNSLYWDNHDQPRAVSPVWKRRPDVPGSIRENGRNLSPHDERDSLHLSGRRDRYDQCVF